MASSIHCLGRVRRIFLLDRPGTLSRVLSATYNWSTDWDEFADWSKNSLLVASVLVAGTPLLLDGEWSDGLTMGTMFVETFSLLLGVTATTKALAGRTRPYAYNTSFTPEERYKNTRTYIWYRYGPYDLTLEEKRERLKKVTR